MTLRGIFLLLEFILCTQFNAACLMGYVVGLQSDHLLGKSGKIMESKGQKDVGNQ